MISKERWKKHRAEYLKRAGLEKFADCEKVLSDLKRKLDTQYQTTNERVLRSENRFLVLFGDHQFTLATPKQDEPTEVVFDLFPKSRFVPLCEVLSTINRVTGFLSAFSNIQRTHVREKP